jgi:beta-lactamase regulating signal transducer with metallopeptidase domain
MAALAIWHPSERFVEITVQIAVAVAVISAIAIGLATCLRHHPAVKHCILLSALICVLLSPVLAGTLARLGDSMSPSVKARHVRYPAAVLKSDEQNADRMVQSSNNTVAQRDQGSSRVIATLVGIGTYDLWKRRACQSLTLAMPLWALGILILLFRLSLNSFRLFMLRRTLHEQTAGLLVDALEDAHRAVGGRRLPRIAVSRRASTPIVTGIMRPVIVLPREVLAALDPVALREVLIHECAHIVRRDQIVIVLQAVAQAAYWPILPVHWLNRRLANAREEVCDNYVLAHQQAANYGETLLRVATICRNLVAHAGSAAMLGWRGPLEKRITELVHERRNPTRCVNPGLAASILGVLALATSGLCTVELVSAQIDSLHPTIPPGTVTKSAVSVILPDPSSPAEKAVASLVFVFYEDWARRAVPGVMVDDKDCTLVLTTTPAEVVPDGIPPAVDRTFLEFAGKPSTAVRYDPRCTAEIHICRAPKGLTSYKLEDTASFEVGDSLDVIGSSGMGKMQIHPDLARVRAINQQYQLKCVAQNLKGLIQVEGAFAEGTPMFKDGKLAGIVIAGSRFVGKEQQRSYLLSAKRIVEFYRTLKRS